MTSLWRPIDGRDLARNYNARLHILPVVEDVMTRHPVTLWAGSSVDDALQRMRGAGVRRVPVVDDRGRLAGIIALDDIFEHLAQRAPFAATPIRREMRFEQAAQP